VVIFQGWSFTTEDAEAIETFKKLGPDRIPSRFLLSRRTHLKKLIYTHPDAAAMMARIGLGLFILPHGAQKVLGWWGGQGIDATVTMMGQNLNIPAFFAYLAIAAEFLGGIGLILGFLSRVAAFGVGVVLAVAAMMVHWPIGFFSGQAGTGWELHWLGFVLALIVMVRGGGLASIDLALSHPEPQADTDAYLGTPTRV
jgi:putative oxidoreductase